jgi:hypothetical protein
VPGWISARPPARIGEGAQRAALAFRVLSVGLCLLFLGGCAYSFTGSNLPSYIKTVAVPNFENETLEPNLGQDVTSIVIDRFIKDGRLKLAPEGQASCRLIAKVVSYENKVNNYAPDQTPRDYVVVLTVSVVLRDQVKNRDLWKDDAITRSSIYVPGGSSGLSTEQDARNDAINNIASDIISRTMEQW